ncbi:MAG: cupin domain-containing protein [Planctomycetota bacterium]
MDIRRIDELVHFGPDRMTKVNLFETPRFFCDIYCLLPGQGQSPHTHATNDKVYLVLTGDPTVRVGEEEARLAPGEAVLAPAGVVHGLSNPTAETVTCLVFMAPHPRPPAGAPNRSA